MAEAHGGESGLAREAGGLEELDVDPRELARRIRAHRAHGGQGLIDFDQPDDPQQAEPPVTSGQGFGRTWYPRG